MLEEERGIEERERCGLGWVKGISYGWGRHRDGCITFRSGSYDDRFGGTCFHSWAGNAPPEGPTWKLNFPEPMEISKVEILNRRDCCHNRIKNNKVYFGDDNYAPVHVGTHNG